MAEREMPEVEVFTAADGEQGLRVVPQVVDVLAENERLRALLDQYQARNERLLFALTNIAQYDPRWKGQHVTNAPSRQQLIERAYDALGGEGR